MLPFIGFGIVLLVWQLVTVVFSVPEYLLPSPASVALRLIAERTLLVGHAEYTLLEILFGYAASIAIGIPLAVAIVLSRTVERLIMPMIVASQAVPKVAIAPILVVWLGFGFLPKVAISFLIAFFPIVVSTVAGLKSVELEMIDLVRSMGAGTAKIMLRVRLPSALPQIFAGLKVAISLAVVGAVVGEFVGSDRGLGYLLLTATGSLDGSLMWAALILLIVLGVSLYSLVVSIERATIRWHVSVRAEEARTFVS